MKPELFLENNISILPIDHEKRPVGEWKEYQTRIITLDEAKQKFRNSRVKGLGAICGHISLGLECLDFDMKNDNTGDVYDKFVARVKLERPDLYNRMAIVATRNNGYHWIYRCPESIRDGLHLARRPATDQEKLETNERVKVLIETRGEGQYFVTVPSNGYNLLQNKPWDPPLISGEEKNFLYYTAQSFNSYFEQPKLKSSESVTQDENDPLTAFNKDGNIIPYLQDEGWTIIEDSPDWVSLKRPGNTTAAHSAYFFKDNNIFFVHSTSTIFDPERGYSQSGVYATLKCEGNFNQARKELAELGFGNLEAFRLPDTQVLEAADDKDRGALRLLLQAFSDKYRYNTTEKQWYRYTDGVWDENGGRQAGLEFADYLVEEYRRVLNDVRAKKALLGVKKKDEDDSITLERAKVDEQEKSLYSQITRYNTVSGMKDLELVCSLSPEFYLTNREFDAAPELINFINGTYDVEKDQFYEHSPSHLLTQQIKYNYNPAAKCPKWLEFLDTTFNGDQELIKFIQMSVGYSFTGYIDIQALWFAYGKGANGKSTFFTAIQNLLGNYIVKTEVDAVLAKKNNNASGYHVASWKGKRFVYCSEMPNISKLNESGVKDVTGGEDIAARQIYSKPEAFTPTHKLWLYGNHKPIVTGTDEGIWRRINLIPFNNTVPLNKRRSLNEMMREFNLEASGIINWALQGVREYFVAGRKIPLPKLVVDANAEYRAESSHLELFLDEVAVKTSPELGCKIKISDLYSAYKRWCDESGEYPANPSRKKFTETLIEEKFEVQRSTGNQNYLFHYQFR